MSRFRVYIAGPITKGNLADNVNQATGAFVSLAKAGFSPLCPHWSVYAKECRPRKSASPDGMVMGERDDECVGIGTRNGNDEMQHADWIGADLPWVEVSHAVLRLPGESTGADEEVFHAVKCGIPVFNSLAALVAHFAKAGAA